MWRSHECERNYSPALQKNPKDLYLRSTKPFQQGLQFRAWKKYLKKSFENCQKKKSISFFVDELITFLGA